ncbi:hypothetical protein ANCCAN_00496 [Ancylostoma caninum]|uniref:aECM cysteine-cradle domain-containing protein n=1 Tax=Ancylostoma caninum TaxID=29170 RepID=A0A368H9Z5_ANCCA|nr:hypothetical protein ANCCAN_00496 [Ancylostoma caninum]
MRLLHLQLGLFTAFCAVDAIGNKLLEDYERKLNSINDRLSLQRAPAKHRWKRYRCIEEYVDEHGNVIEEGKEHVTTPAPVTTAPIPKKSVKAHRVHGVKNTPVVVPGKTTATKGLKVTLVKKKRKSKGGRRGRVENRLPVTEEDMYLTRVYPTTTTTTTPVAPTTEITQEEESVDEKIMKKYFEPSRPSIREQQRNRVDIVEQIQVTEMEETATASNTLAAPTLSTPLLGDSDVSDHIVDRDRSDELERPSYRRHRNRGRVTSYTRRGLDYDANYDDYNYIDDELPFVRRRMGRRRMRKYLAYPSVRYPGRREFTFTKVPPLPANYFATPRPAAFPPYTAVTVAPANVGESTPETCRRMRRLAATFGISDISDYAKRNCRFLQTFAPGYTCEQIVHFVNSCDKNNFS